MSDDKDDSKWMGTYGDCKICHGEIPHGHTDTCYIHKMQMMERDYAQLQQSLSQAKAELVAINTWLTKEFSVGGKMCDDLLDDFECFMEHHKIVDKERDKAQAEVERLKRERKYIFAELSECYKGLMMHPEYVQGDGYCISAQSKIKIEVLKELIDRYEQPENL